MKRLCAIVFLLLFTTACSTITDYAADTIKNYCSSTTELERAAIRERFNNKIAPHEVLIYCDKS